MRIQVKIPPRHIGDEEYIAREIHKKVPQFDQNADLWYISKRSLDARKRPIYVLTIVVGQQRPEISIHYKPSHKSPEVFIVGAGPAGYFAALRLIEKGIRPIVLDRGKDVRSRRRDLRGIQQFGIVHPESNYCFGEGGAGTYSDGKLYTRSVKRGKITDILQILVDHGAKSDILVDAHPHIGSNKLPQIVSNLRRTIEQFGGEVRFESKVTDFVIQDGRICKLVINEELELEVEQVILATGHSARDIYHLLEQKRCTLEFKPFAMGVRIEHPQRLIDEIQYGKGQATEELPAASYKLICQINHRGVFSFCMCPGGLIVPASTAPGELVVNGMSLSRRDSPFANSGTVVQIEQQTLSQMGYHGTFAGLNFQRAMESAIWQNGTGSQSAPAQRLTDFVKGQMSSGLPESSYIPGVYSAPMHEILPEYIASHLREAVQVFGQKMKGYYTSEAQVIGLESRTSAPVRIPREESFEHPDVRGLYPCGEGAGYAGGILSAAIDGRNVADKIIQKIYPLK